MNQTIEKMLVHASVRDFKAEPLPAQTKDLLLKAAQSGASSNFIQAYSIIEVADVNLSPPPSLSASRRVSIV